MSLLESVFLNSYFGTPLNCPEDPFYWKKAFSDFCSGKTGFTSNSERAANFAENIMNGVYFGSNLFNSFAPVIQSLVAGIPLLGISWNIIDSLGAWFLAASDDEKQDARARNINILSGVQLSLATSFYALINYIPLSPALFVILSPVATAASSFAFASAMIIAWFLEDREVKLHRKRIDELSKKISELEQTPKVKEIIRPESVSNNPKQPDIEKKINSLKELLNEKQNSNYGTQDLIKDLINLLEFKQHQEQQLKIHIRNRRVWKLCSVCMLVVAVVGTILAFPIIANPLAVAVILAASSMVALLASAIYRLKPELFDKQLTRAKIYATTVVKMLAETYFFSYSIFKLYIHMPDLFDRCRKFAVNLTNIGLFKTNASRAGSERPGHMVPHLPITVTRNPQLA